MSTVEVLAPLRLETRFVPPALRVDGVNEWMLKLRVYPDEFSIPRSPAPPNKDELDRLTEAITKMSGLPPLSEADAFASFASAVGAGRALALWRAHVVPDGAGGLTVDRTGEAAHVSFSVHAPVGLPKRLEIWFIHKNGTRQLKETLNPNVVEIAKDLDLMAWFNDAEKREALAAGTLPKTWWLSYERALEVKLAVDLDIGLTPPTLDALVVLGIGDTDAADLVDAHNASGRMAVLAPGTPTNTVAGEPTTDFGEHAESIFPLLHVDPKTQSSTSVVLTGLTGRVAPSALPMLGGNLDYLGPGSLAVQGLWPVLWGRYLRDVTGAGENEISLARWAIHNLPVEGPRPAFRVGEQPYGLLPTSAFSVWVDVPGDQHVAIERAIRRWAIPWRAGAAAAARAAKGQVSGADTRRLLRVLGLHAPSRYWKVRAVADLYQLQAWRALAGKPVLDTAWDKSTARALRNFPSSIAPVGRAPGEAGIPGPKLDEEEDVSVLRSLPTMNPEPLLHFRGKLGLVGHLFREALLNARALLGDAFQRLTSGTPISLGQSLTWTDEGAYQNLISKGTNGALITLREGADLNGRVVAERFKEVQEALQVFADLWETMSSALFRAVLAALDTAAFRCDPWLLGIADRRLQRMIATGAPFKLGAYGWVDAPAPYTGQPDGPLAPGPTAAGLLHTPSPAQAMTAALLRDAAVRYPGSDRWNLTIDSAKIRAAIALSERVRLGLHPYEALGLEVEKIAGDWEIVRELRKKYPLVTDQPDRRVCDGQKVLRAAREGTLVAGLPVDLPERLAPLDHVLDTYADLLVADGVHALVTGHAEIANAAMEAAAGLGAPPDLRSIRTPRQATEVRVSVWALLPPAVAAGGANADPVRVADPAYAALLDAELEADAISATDAATREKRNRLAAVFGGAEDEGLVPSLTGGEELSEADAKLRKAIATDLKTRLTKIVALAQDAHDALDDDDFDPEAPGSDTVIAGAATRWNVNISDLAPADPAMTDATETERRDALVAVLADRLSVAAKAPALGSDAPPDAFFNAVKRVIRTVVGRPDLPVLPIIDRALLPGFRTNADLDQEWLEIVAAVRPRLAALEASQLDPERPDWTGAVAAPDSSTDPWHSSGPVVVAYGPGVNSGGTQVAIAALDGWTDSVPSRHHNTVAAFGFNAPKSRAPQAVLVAVPPDISQRLDNARLLDVILETRELVHARTPRQIPDGTLPHAMSTALVSASAPRNFLDGWPQ